MPWNLPTSEREISPLTPNKETIDCTNETCMFVTLHCTPQAHTHLRGREVRRESTQVFSSVDMQSHRYLFSFGNVQLELACLYSIYCIRILLCVCVYALHIIVLHLHRYILKFCVAASSGLNMFAMLFWKGDSGRHWRTIFSQPPTLLDQFIEHSRSTLVCQHLLRD